MRRNDKRVTAPADEIEPERKLALFVCGIMQGMSDKPDLLNLATDKQRDRIHDLIDALPTEYFGMHDGWVDIVKELYKLVTDIEQMQALPQDRDPRISICLACGKPATNTTYTFINPTSELADISQCNMSFEDFCDEHKPITEAETK